ncbi:MAG TPA: phage major capsid protein [Thermodesulfobacteriaceae bacterium]|nr:phage major capsid protein [Thermodesulfobacteriaceae bacterium]
MAVQNDILSSTARARAKVAVDNLFQSTPLLQLIKAAGGVEIINGGQRITRAAILAEHSNITQLATGYEPVATNVADVLRSPEFEWCDFAAPIVITKKEELSNKGDNSIISIADARMKSVMGMLKREWELQTIRGTSTILTELQSLNGIDTAQGWLEELPFGAPLTPQTNTVGGLSKNTFLASNWNNQVGVVTPNFAGNGLDEMADLMIQSSIYAHEGGVDLILASPNSYRNYKNQLQGQERYMPKETVLDGGRLALAYNGALMYVDVNLGNAVGANTPSMYFLNTKSMKVVFDSEANFAVGDFEHKSGYAAREAHIYVRSQLVADHLASLGVLTNAEV